MYRVWSPSQKHWLVSVPPVILIFVMVNTCADSGNFITEIQLMLRNTGPQQKPMLRTRSRRRKRKHPSSILFLNLLLDSIPPHGVHLEYCFEAALPILNLDGICGCHCPSGVSPRVDVTPTSRSDSK